MGDDEIAVRVTAQINGLVDGMGEATRTIQTSTQQMGGNLESLATKSEGASIGFGRLERSLASLVISATGADPHLGHVAAIVGSMALDGPIIVGALLGLGALGYTYEHLTASATDFAKAQEKVNARLDEAAKKFDFGGQYQTLKGQADAQAKMAALEPEIARLQNLINAGINVKNNTTELNKLREEFERAKSAAAEFHDELVKAQTLPELSFTVHGTRDAAKEKRDWEERISTGLAMARGEAAKDAATKKEIDNWQTQWNKAIDKVVAETRALPGEMGALVNKETETDLVTAQMKLQRVLNQTQRSIETVIGGVMAVSDAAFARWVTGAATIGQTFSELSRQILLSMIHSIERAFEVWLATEIMKRTIGAQTAKQSILHDAYGAAASAFHSTAGIPFVGPILAPLAAAAAFAAVAAFGSGISSAAGGFDIPSGVNPMTQLHAREMVLPASLADGLRGLIAGGGGGGGVTVYAMDAKSFQDYLHTNRDSLVPALRTLARNGAL